MIATWKIDSASIALWRRLVEDNCKKDIPLIRIRRNVRRIGIDLSRQNIWRAHVASQITTQQRSGPDSPVGRFMKSESPALDLRQCRDSANLSRLLRLEMTRAGLWRASPIAGNLSLILDHLEDGGWKPLLDLLATLRTRPTAIKERAVVKHLLSENFPGLGQKQSRNLIQELGLSRHEIPIDSRVLKRMSEFGANFVPSPRALSDSATYVFVQHCLQQISSALGIYPCVLDACIFASFED